MIQDGLSGKRILLGVTGSIAAYKAVDLLRRMQDHGAHVRVAMTRNAERFVSRLTFETLSRMPVLSEEFRMQGQSGVGHIEATDNIDAVVIAPATADVIGKIAAGIADDTLTSAVMAASCPLVIAPAMNDRMYCNPILKRNIESLKGLGVRFVDPDTGGLACGAVGQGRLAEIERIIAGIAAVFKPQRMKGRSVLVTAGPTREAIDAVRFISNPSTGKMGYALAAAACDEGADVILVTGPTQIPVPPGVRVVAVESAREMYDAVLTHSQSAQIIVMAAAVSDFRPVSAAPHKVKKDEASMTLQLERTADILQDLGRMKKQRVLIGFAAETDNVERNARKKLEDKNLDLIIANDVNQDGAGFAVDTNSVVILGRSGMRRELKTMAKIDIARAIMDEIIGLPQYPAS